MRGIKKLLKPMVLPCLPINVLANKKFLSPGTLAQLVFSNF